MINLSLIHIYKNTLSQVVDAVIVELGGFAVFNDKEKQAFLRKLAKERCV